MTDAKHGDVARGPGWELWCGDYRKVLDFINVEDIGAVIADPPYSRRTHKGHDSGVGGAKDGSKDTRRKISYEPWADLDVHEFFDRYGEVDGWIVAFSDHVLTCEYELGAEVRSRYPFAPLVWYAPGSRVRMVGDGPACWTTQINVSRPSTKEFAKWGALPGGYHSYRPERGAHIGGKPVELMRAIVRDYSRSGTLVVDPCAGYGSTLMAAAIEGRDAVGAELDPETYERAVARLRKGYTPTFDFGDEQ